MIAVKIWGPFLLSFLLSTVAGGVLAAVPASGKPPLQTPVSMSSAATRWPSPSLPPSEGAVRDAPLDPRSLPATPMPAPAESRHYADFMDDFSNSLLFL
jgi:hypothetical protein